MKLKNILLLTLILFISSQLYSEETTLVDPNDIQFNHYVHESLPDELLVRIKATTDIFESIDGVSYEQAVDLYKRDLDPESNLVIWEEMVRVYKLFCLSRCSEPTEKADVYRTLLLRSMFNNEETLQRIELQSITKNDALEIITKYKLKAVPISVYKSEDK